MNVLVYNGSGVSSASRDYALYSLKSFLSSAYDVQLVSPKSLRTEPWEDSCAALVFPGGRDLPYQYDLAGKGNDRIRQYVKNGGRYLGFCAGAYYASARVEFEVGSELEVVGDRELRFFPGVCKGTAFPGFEYSTEAGAREVAVQLNRTAWRDHWSQSPESVQVWYNGGGYFVEPEEGSTSISVLGRYSQLPGSPVAGVKCDVGSGTAVLWGVHPEHPTLADPSSAWTPPEHSTEKFEEKEHRRKGLLRMTLAILGLEVSDVPAQPPKLLPLFLTSPDPEQVTNVFNSFTHKSSPPATDLKDRHDHFVLQPQSDARSIVADHKSQPGSTDVDELHSAKKDIIVCSDGIPATDVAPLFDLQLYFRLLQEATSSPSPSFGGILLYGEAVTSTQTMLDKNDKFLAALPTGLACLASHQIAGRGRGGNTWVSPAGCLQFSLVLRLPSPQSSKIVFIQYLFGLAVVEAVRTRPGYEDVGVRLKWPNDIYGDLGVDGNGKKVYKKIGGILVNSSYAGDQFSLVVGCGINTSNPLPTTSINELVSYHNSQTGSTLAPFTQEVLLAAVMAKFSTMWPVFLEQGFGAFTDLYLTRWIHQNQRVTIQSTSQVVKIIGITPDHGLLRTVVVDMDRYGNEVFGGGGGGQQKFVDLQPDGNGFDMIQNLLVAR
ncbi:hypothetical protein MNV49_005392 [Pseudohyphozyma bogoriensis]|nr:hypothetical protein MNV49_005392 [Pseudohyphozyma bogoriensis]